MTVRVVATCAPGAEDLLEGELADAGARVLPLASGLRGRAFAEVGRLRDAARLLLSLRVADRLGVVVGEADLDPAAPLADARRFARDLALEAWMAPAASFAVRARRHGEHSFRRLDLEREVGGTLHDRFAAAWGAPPRVDLADADVLVRLDVDAAHHLVAWADLVGGEPLHRRGYRAHDHPAALRSTLAAALLRLAGWRGEGLLADAMVGGGTLTIEAAWIAHGFPAVALRRGPLQLTRAGPLADEPLAALLPAPAPIARHDAHLVAADRNGGELLGARRNLAAAGVLPCARLLAAEAAELPKYAPGARVVVANPPYGIRIGSKEEIRSAHRDLLVAGAQAIGTAGRVAVVTPRLDLVREFLPESGLRLVEERRALAGEIPVHLVVAA